jgi:alpha-beta hydrolase superfamily lysophospholipase
MPAFMIKKIFNRVRSLALIFLIIFTCCGSLYARSTPPQNWYDNFIFKDPTYNYEFIRTLGYSYTKGADLGECISTAKKIKEGDFNSWYTAWNDTANRIAKLADTAARDGHVVTSREAYFRAANYYRTAGFFAVASTDRANSINAYQKSKLNFLKAIRSIPYIEVVHIPYENTTLTGYLIHAQRKNAPIVIVNTGFDGTAEELYFEVGVALHDRGYHSLLIEGPGQGNVLRQQHLYFRPDWEKVVTPIVDFVETLPDVNKKQIALMGISMGGYLAPRAAAFEPRIAALIANGGVYDFGEAIRATLPKELIQLSAQSPEDFNQAIYREMQTSTVVKWFYENGMWSFHTKTPAEFLQKVNAYSLKNVAQKIKASTLVIDSEADDFMKGQANQLYQHLQSPKQLLVFTRKEAAQSHCQMGANAVSNELIFDWLDSVFKQTESLPNR